MIMGPNHEMGLNVRTRVCMLLKENENKICGLKKVARRTTVSRTRRSTECMDSCAFASDNSKAVLLV